MNVTIFGAGYVGLVTGTCLAAIGHDVTCVDVVRERVDAINAGKTPIYESGLDKLLADTLSTGRFRATVDAENALRNSDLSMIAVGTPPRGDQIDLSYVEQVARTIGRHLRHRDGRHTVVVKSTVVPGTTAGLVREKLEHEANKKAGKDFGLAMNPEFLREGCAVDDFMNPDRVVIGQFDGRSGDAVAELYARFDCPKPRVTLVDAEFIKYASNTLLATLVSFSNELYRLCENTTGADGETIMDGLALDRRLSPMVRGERVSPGILAYLRGGVGYGGSCLPKDIAALQAYARGCGIPTPLLDAVTTVNIARPTSIADVLGRTLCGLEGKTIGVLGLAFKPETDDLRDSPALPLVEELLRRGARVRAYDPKAHAAAAVKLGDRIQIVLGSEELFIDAHAAVVTTAWPTFKTWDYATLVDSMKEKVIVDGRNALRHVVWPSGTRYVPVGRGLE